MRWGGENETTEKKKINHYNVLNKGYNREGKSSYPSVRIHMPFPVQSVTATLLACRFDYL